MMRRMATVLIVAMLLICTLFLPFNNKIAKTNSVLTQIITVPDDYPTIQEAIDSADPGDIIYVLGGTYHEHLKVNKPLTLLGENKESTIIDGDRENQTIIEVTANNAIISEFTVQNSSRVAGTSYSGIKVSSNDCNITGNIVAKTKIGIFVISQRSRITENIVRNNGQGIALYSSNEVTVEANNLTENTVGISLAISTNNIITNNRAENSSFGGHGIILSSNSLNNRINSNDLVGNFHGMWLSSSSNNKVYNNTIANNELLGIELAGSSNNKFYHNNIIYNPTPVRVDTGTPSESICIWDNGCEGNYWSDYSGSDSDGDGISDTPYIIDENNQDNHPLMNPYWDPADINHDLIVNIFDVVSVCSVYTSTSIDLQWNCHCDIAEPIGVIDMDDIEIICTNYGEEWS